MTNVLWQSATVDQARVDRYVKLFQVPQRVARWLCLRNVAEGEVLSWLDPETSAWSSPYEFTDMKQAVDILLDAVAKRIKICIVGDYDVDGVTSSTIVASTLQLLGADWACMIPHRIEDGYGLSVSLVERAHALGCGVIVTVDNGIRATEAIQVAVRLGITVVLTDHHEPGDSLPTEASAIVHWVRAAGTETSLLSGAGVAWKLATALMEHADSTHVPTDTLQALRAWHHGLAALGALADVMPMRGENRKLVKAGIDVLKSCNRPGWKALCNIANVHVAELTDTALAWSISPRLNAAGRMGSAETAFRLLMADNLDAAALLADQIEAWNVERRRETDRVYEEAVAAFERDSGAGQPSSIVVAGPWNLGVVGIVAAKLVGHYGLPAIVFADDGTEVLRGSGRAPEGFPLHDALVQCQEWMVHFGGHEAAVGCAVHRDHVDLFRQAVAAAARARPTMPDSDGAVADDYLPLADANLDTVQWLQKFSPFGPRNPALRFYIGPVEIIEVTHMGKGKQHLRVKVREGKTQADLVWFQAPEEAGRWTSGLRIAAVCHLEENIWQGVSRAQLRIESAFLLKHPLMRDDFGAVYRVLQARRKLTAEEASVVVSKHRHPEAQVIFDTFVDLGFAHWQESAYHVVEQVVSRDLRDSQSYQKHLWQSASGRY